MAKPPKKGSTNRYDKQKRQQERQLPPRPSPRTARGGLLGAQETAPAAPGDSQAMQTIAQRRAAYALRVVRRAQQDGLDAKRFVSYANNLPAMIHMNGLGQTAAFYLSKGAGEREYRRLYDILSEWLGQRDQPYAGQALLDGITGHDLHRYRLAQAEAMALMDWVKKFAKAFMGEGQEAVGGEA